MLCEYGCGQEATHQFKNGKWCCSKIFSSCPAMKNKNSFLNKGRIVSKETRLKLSIANTGLIISDTTRKKISKSLSGEKHPHFGKKFSEKTRKKISEALTGKKLTTSHKINIGLGKKLIISYIKEKYPIFCKDEKMRYNPDKLGKNEIQVHCKNSNCENSLEKGGWFTPTYIQLYERIRQIEKEGGNGGSYLYCCEKCKQKCPIYNIKSDPYKILNISYTPSEYRTFRQEVLQRSNNLCEYCGNLAAHVHHSRPQKLEPFFSLDPDFGISCCEECHYKHGHKDECSTGKIANVICKEI